PRPEGPIGRGVVRAGLVQDRTVCAPGFPCLARGAHSGTRSGHLPEPPSPPDTLTHPPSLAPTGKLPRSIVKFLAAMGAFPFVIRPGLGWTGGVCVRHTLADGHV